MKRTASLRTRIVAMFLAVVCIVGLIPTAAFAAETASVPGTVTLKNADYHVSNPIIYNYGPLDDCYIHEFTMNVAGVETVGFCGDHSAEMGNSLIGDVWDTPQEITDKNIKLLLSHYYSYATGKFSPAGEAQNLTPYDEYTKTWAQGWFQGCVWLAQIGALPDYETDPEGWIEEVATQRMLVVNAYHDAGYDWAQHYTSIDDPDGPAVEGEEGWTCRAAAEYILNHPDWWGDWSIYMYDYADKGSDSHPDPSKIQSIIIGIYEPTGDIENPCELIIKKVDSSNQNKGLQGAQFQVTAIGGSFDKVYTTDENGLITIDETENGFGPGTYGVTEIKAPSGYTISDTSTKYVTVGEGDTASATFTFYDDAEITGSGSIRKVDKDNPTVGLEGAVIEIRGIDNGYGPTRVITGPGGYVSEEDFSFKDLPIGAYIAEEVGVPEGYTLSDDPDENMQEFYWDGTSNVQLVFQNDSKVKVQLKKVDESGQPLEGAIFNIYKDSQLIGTQATDAQGTITVPNVTEGFYYFIETEAPDGYAKLSTPVGVHVDEADI